MFNFLNPFKTPTANAFAIKSLAEAKLTLLKAHEAREYADSIVVQKTKEIDRLEKFLLSDGNKTN